MSEFRLLDTLAARRSCDISDLNLVPLLRRATRKDLSCMEKNAYPLSQWQDAALCLTGDERVFERVQEIKDFILKETEAW